MQALSSRRRSPAPVQKARAARSVRPLLQWVLAGAFVAMTLTFLFLWRPLVYMFYIMLPIMLISTYWYSRGFCGWACPRAAFLEKILAKISLKRPVPAFMKQSWFAALFAVLLYGNLIWQITTKGWMAGAFVACLVPSIIAVAVGLYSPKAWCAFCPNGTLLKLADLERFRVGKVSKCTKCGLCDKACPFGVSVSELAINDLVDSPICVQCGSCVQACPVASLALPAPRTVSTRGAMRTSPLEVDERSDADRRKPGALAIAAHLSSPSPPEAVRARAATETRARTGAH